MKLFKKLNRGQKLRRKSEVHKSIIGKKTGRRKLESTGLVDLMLKERKENWISKGKKLRPDSESFLRKDTAVLKEIKQPKIMVLGPGEGQEVLFLNNLLKGSFPKIDVFGITNELSTEAKKIVRNVNYPNPEKLSERDLFEHFNHLKFVRKYDYIFSDLGPIEHTRNPEIAVLKLASMLKPGGFARVSPAISQETHNNIIKYLKIKGHEKSLSIDNTIPDGYLLIKRVK